MQNVLRTTTLSEGKHNRSQGNRARLLALVSLFALASGCSSGTSEMFQSLDTTVAGSNANNTLSGFEGCSSGAALDTSRIRVQFAFPTNATKIIISRDGNPAASFMDHTSSAFTDSGLIEGQDYRYTCDAVIDGVTRQGANSLLLTTTIENAPNFEGIQSATAAGAHAVTVRWKSATGVSVSHYEVYYKLGATLNMNEATPASEIPVGTIQTTITGLGDELPYKFGVRACSAPGLCDTNTLTLSATTPDGGAPTTFGVTAASASNGQAVLTIPWSHTQGAVAKRRVYQSLTGGTDIGNYTLIQTIDNSSTPSSPTTSLTITGIAENSSYYFIARDEDPSGNIETNTNVASVQTGDLTPPSFPGLSSLTATVPKDTVLTASFSAIASQPGDATGASHYLIYRTQAAHPDTPTDPCAAGTTLLTQLDATLYATSSTVEVPLTGLTARTNYRVCIKARDQAGNISSTVASLQATTWDITPPTFDGLQTLTYSAGTQNLNASWNRSPSTDRKQYKIRIWKNTTTPLEGNITTLVREDSGYPTGVSLATTDFSFTDGDTVYAVVDACDNASPTFNVAANCTSYAIDSAKSVLVPDSTPPPGFQGVAGPGSFATPSQGSLTVAWIAPVLWSDYRGFLVYHVADDESLTLLRDCACTAAGCPTQPTTCTVSGLDAFRTYKIHVRAYDAAGNITTYAPLNPGTPDFNYTSKQTSDTTAPSFVSNLTAVWDTNTGTELSWSAAIDNQFAAEPGYKLEYKVYRKKDATFATATSPAADGTLLSTQETLAYTDLKAGLDQGATYYYAACALDASGNAKCDGTVKSISVADYTNPILSVIDTDKKDAQIYAKTWALTWSMSDNATASDSLLVTIRKKQAATASDFPIPSDAIYSSGMDLWGLSGETGPADTAIYVNYLVTVQDAAGNKASQTISIYSDNMGPTAATALTWVQTSPYQGLTVTATWNKSAAAELTKEEIQFFSNATCDSTNPLEVVGAPTQVTLGANPQTKSFSATEGTFSYRILSWDEASNYTSTCSTAIVTDTQPSTVVAVRGQSADGLYQTSETIDLQMEFNETVLVTTTGGTPTLLLETGTTDRTATYISGSGSKFLRFRYIVQFGDGNTDLNYQSTGALALNSGTIKDQAGNSALLTLPGFASGNSLAELASIVVDTNLPSIFIASSVATHTNDATPDLILTALTGTTEMYITNTAACASGGAWEPFAASKANWPLAQTNSAAAVFVKYRDAGLVESECKSDTIVHDDIAPTITITSPAADSTHGTGLTLQGSCEGGIPIALSGTGLSSPTAASCIGSTYAIPVVFTGGDGAKAITVSQTDQAGNETQSSRNFVADTTGPTITSITPPGDATYNVGGNLDFTVNFDEAVSLSGTPRLTLLFGATPKYADCAGSGTSIACRYTVIAGDVDADGIFLSSPVELNGGSVQDAFTNNATLTFTSTQYAGVIVDGQGPTVSSITPPSNATYYNAQSLTFTVIFNEPITVGGTPRLTLTVGFSSKYANCAKTASMVLTCSYTIVAGDSDSDGIALAASIDLNGGSIMDSFSNNGVLTLTPPNLANVKVDASPPAAATNLGWVQPAYHASNAITTIWTKSASADLSLQRMQLYTGACAAAWNSPMDIASSVEQVAFFFGTNGTTYSYMIQSLDSTGNSTWSACSSTVMVDTSAPVAPATIDDGNTGSAAGFLDRAPIASWPAATDTAGSGVNRYELAVGTTASGNQIKDWTSVGNVLSAAVTGITLVDGTTYYTSVRAVDNAGNISAIRSGDGWVASAGVDCANKPVGPGARCTDGTIYLGKIGSVKYRATPGGCTDSASPTCAGGTDTVLKSADSTYCEDMSYGGYTDWVLPTKDELDFLRTAKLGGVLGLGLEETVPYWSSTADGGSAAWAQLISDGSQTSRNNTDQLQVHCVRRISDPCAGTPNPATVCSNDLYYLGAYNGFKYQTTPGGCTDSSTPVCNGATDSLTKSYSSYGTVAPTSPINGAENTATLAAGFANAYLAKYCQDLVYEGYTDWFLPATNEMQLFYTAKNAGFPLPGLYDYYYGTSTEANSTYYYIRHPGTGGGTQTDKISNTFFRCVRKEGAPTAPSSVAVGPAKMSLSASPDITWVASNASSPEAFSHYEIAVGTTVGGTNTTGGWVNVGNVTQANITGLSLIHGTTYYPSVRAVDIIGGTSAAGQNTFGWIAYLTDPCDGTPNPGTICGDGLIHVGSLNGVKYKTPPGGCTDSATPLCSGSPDTVAKTWGPRGVISGTPSTTDGLGNTTTLANGFPTAYAAKYCAALNYEGYSTDWFLPAKDELSLFQAALTGGYTIRGLVMSQWYYSSTEIDTQRASGMAFAGTGGAFLDIVKDGGMRVRCMRTY